jgi:uncharacterized OB-fold protein
MKKTNARVLPVLTPLNEAFWTSGRNGHLSILRCSDCDTWLHPPAPVCPNCLGRNLAPQQVSGSGVIESYTINHQAWLPGDTVPYTIAIVSLDEIEDLRLTTSIVGAGADTVRIGSPVRVLFERHDDVWIPLFTPK